jgi:PAS domain S-box-containing protein
VNPRLILAILLPFIACGVQWLLWDAYIKPYVWFLFFPAAFFSAWLGGLRGGLAGTVIGALLAWYVYIPPQFSLVLEQAASAASVALFVMMGSLYAWIFERLTQAKRRTDAALAETRAANDKITELYRKTLELDELKSQFFANVSHELRTPLTLIMAPLERRLADARQEGETDREAEMMLRNARLLYRHVSDLLDAAKLEAGRMTVNWAKLDLAYLTRTIASHFESLAHERRIDYPVTAPDTLPAEGDGEKIQRVLLNLLSNAFKFTPDGGRIEVRLSVQGGEALIEVADNGPGVPAGMRQAVFERFRQVVEGGSQRHHGGTGLGLAIVKDFVELHGGTGLGLAIVKDFVELHGGTVGLAEAPGGGALFSLRLPLTAPAGAVLTTPTTLDAVIDRQAIEALQSVAPAAAGGEAASDAAMGGTTPLVLVVEDNADMREFIAASLRPHYRVASAGDGRAGLARALALLPDLIVSDVTMPEMSGDEMVAELRLHPAMVGVPIVMLTAKADEALRVKLLREGVQGYLNKPFSVEELLARVSGLLAERRRTSEQLRMSEARFEATFEQAAVGIALVAPDGAWLRVNHKLCEIVGYSAAELLGKTFRDITHPDDLDADLDQVRRMLAREIDSYAMEKRYIRKDGGIVWIKLSVALVWKPDGTPDYFISVVEDIRARKQAEAELKGRNAELERFDRAAVGREQEMIRLKQRVNELAHELGREAPFDLSFVTEAGKEGQA